MSAFAPPSFDVDGFVHCSFRDQVEKTASAVDYGRQGLVLLCIDNRELPVVVEDCYDIGEPYPHVYGVIPVDSVVAVLPFPPTPDGSFTLPPGTPRL